MKDLTTVSTDLYNKVRSRFSNVKLGDSKGGVIQDGDPAKARFFELKYTFETKDIGSVVIKIDEEKLAVIFSNSMVEGDNSIAKDDWYAFLKEMREFAMSNMLKFDTRDITKSNLDQRDFQYLAKENGDGTMSESKLFGTSKTSYQDMGEARIIVKHSQPVNYNIPAGRTMHIDSIYIESANGERFRYPHKHLNGARAMAMHIANGGTSYDNIGQHISSLSEELSKLRQFKNYTQRNGLSEALNDISEKVITRIDSIKEEIASLQKQNYYEQFKEQFQPTTEIIIPEETVDAWVDALTIRTFNEELKNVFPFIYRLVDRPQEITYEDLVSEEKCPECEMDPCECDHNEAKETNEDSMFAEFEDQIDGIAALDMDQAQESDMDIEQEQPMMPQVDPRVMSKAIVEFVKSMYNAEDGSFPRGEEGVKIAVEKRFGDQAGQFAARVIEALKGGI